ncbi:MAG: phosphatidate cytidylyltransferase [Thermoanaerobaculia bacterium]|jgi:phosphatidate cytidylyltransferase
MSDTTLTAPPRRFLREITSAICAPLLIWFIGWVPLAMVATIGLAGVLALWEFLALGRAKGYPIVRWTSMFFGVVLLLSFFLPGKAVLVAVFLTILVIPAIYSLVPIELSEALPACAVSVFAVLYIGLTVGASMRLRLDFEPYGGDLIFFLLLVVWLNDAGAYYVGKNFGKTKMSPRVSPKKTVEGLIGGLVVAMITAAVVHFTFFPEFPLPHAMACALLISIAGVIGDLAESVWKRSAGVKDSGAMIPGHGGFLDRLDSVIFTAPILYVYWALLTRGIDWLK